MMKYKSKSKKGVSLVIVVLAITTIMAFAGLVVDIGMVQNCQNELQKATENAALVAASTLEPFTDSYGNTKIDTTKATAVAQDIFNYLKNPFIDSYGNISVEIKPKSKAVYVKSSAKSRTYFLQVVGIHYINVEAQASAMSSPSYLSENSILSIEGSSIMTDTTVDTHIRDPLGDTKNASLNYAYFLKKEHLMGLPDNNAIHLGPGGYITIKLAKPIIDAEGPDLYIAEAGNMEGYFVFVGTDKDSSNPYINEAKPGAGIEWTNISCTGIPSAPDSSGYLGAYYTLVDYLNGSPTAEAKFYGSGYFDLGGKCINGMTETYGGTAGRIAAAKYIKIIDDNTEDGFMADNPSVPVLLLGEHSGITPGADIDAISIFHKTRLIRTKDFFTDTDGDGLIDILEAIIGTDPNDVDHDADGISDGLEYSGYYFDGAPIAANAKSIIDAVGNIKAYFTSPRAKTDINTIVLQ